MSWMLLLFVFGLALVVFILVMIGMAAGFILCRKKLTGSCGGIGSQMNADGSTNCSLCSSPDKECDEFAGRAKVSNKSDL